MFCASTIHDISINTLSGILAPFSLKRQWIKVIVACRPSIWNAYVDSDAYSRSWA